MNLHFKSNILLFSLILIMAISGCKKYLDEKPNKNQVVPVSLKDAQALLDYYITINQSDLGSGEVCADDYYLTDAKYLTMSENFRRMYLWNKDYLFAPGINDWGNLYKNIYLANTALEVTSKLTRINSNAAEWDNVKGQALFFRAHFFLQGAFIWCLAYDDATSATDPGLPLRLNTNFNEPSVRSTVKQTYMQIITDLTEAIQLLPNVPFAVTRPSKQAAYALLARTYLAMRDYVNAGKYADLCLSIKDELADYNDLIITDTYPIKQFNKEVIFESRMSIPIPLVNTNARITQSLYDSYASDDLRKTAFFLKNTDETYSFKGSYEGGIILFSGISLNEIYLIRAESYARQDEVANAMKDLNYLLNKRWKKDNTGKTLYADQTAGDKEDALKKILLERRKELLFRGLRWADIKRLNKEGYNIVLTRTIAGITYTLAPNDPKYALTIPEDVISASGMPQN